MKLTELEQSLYSQGLESLESGTADVSLPELMLHEVPVARRSFGWRVCWEVLADKVAWNGRFGAFAALAAVLVLSLIHI